MYKDMTISMIFELILDEPTDQIRLSNIKCSNWMKSE